jgi:hypothetical protein
MIDRLSCATSLAKYTVLGPRATALLHRPVQQMIALMPKLSTLDECSKRSSQAQSFATLRHRLSSCAMRSLREPCRLALGAKPIAQVCSGLVTVGLLVTV